MRGRRAILSSERKASATLSTARGPSRSGGATAEDCARRSRRDARSLSFTECIQARAAAAKYRSDRVAEVEARAFERCDEADRPASQAPSRTGSRAVHFASSAVRFWLDSPPRRIVAVALAGDDSLAPGARGSCGRNLRVSSVSLCARFDRPIHARWRASVAPASQGRPRRTVTAARFDRSRPRKGPPLPLALPPHPLHSRPPSSFPPPPVQQIVHHVAPPRRRRAEPASSADRRRAQEDAPRPLVAPAQAAWLWYPAGAPQTSLSSRVRSLDGSVGLDRREEAAGEEDEGGRDISAGRFSVAVRVQDVSTVSLRWSGRVEAWREGPLAVVRVVEPCVDLLPCPLLPPLAVPSHALSR